MNKLLITGATGFIGQALIKKLKLEKYSLNISTRNYIQSTTENLKIFNLGSLENKIDWADALYEVDCVIHCAGRAHIINDNKKKSIDIFRKVNVDGTINLAKQASISGIRRFIFLSSIKVNGERTIGNLSFKYNDISNANDSYSISKWEAEQQLWELSKKTGLEVVIIRVPLVYGPGVKGNLERLIKLINFGIPLPFSLIKNERSLIGIDNLIDLIIRCIEHKNASGKTLLVSDDETFSTPDLLKIIANSMGRSVRLFPFPIILLKILGFILGRSNEVNRLVGSLKVDIEYTKNILNWKPPVSVQKGIQRMLRKNDTFN